MTPTLKQETESLARSWAQHQSAWLRDYLVAGVEDPRINLQSILSRHFILRSLTAERFVKLMEAEYRFAAVMNWLLKGHRFADPEELKEILHALRHGQDNAEGLPIPLFVQETFAGLPAAGDGFSVPNYIDALAPQTQSGSLPPRNRSPVFDTFLNLWRDVLAPEIPGQYQFEAGGEWVRKTLSVLEPACGSANDYRFLRSFGIGRLIDYTGFDLCEKNIENAKAHSPDVRFEKGNVFEIDASDQAFDLLFVHDLFEHLSLEGLAAAVAEVCRVTRWGICAGFFNMDEIPEHSVQPFEEYHWNRLSMARTKELFQARGFDGQVIHIGTFLRRQLGCEKTHNPNAYTFLLQARR